MSDQAPLVFISYSHDSDEHKEWVLKLATRLTENGINVLLDQWDVALGDDFPKFMERVRQCDRVLMICTATYVAKADEGEGGVGYEAMIVTAELVTDLGTNKFIPVIRQADGEVALPVSVGTRRWIDFRESLDFDAQFEELLRELHTAPARPKPRIGPNPFLESDDSSAEETTSGGGISRTYYDALNTARDGDMATWRRLVRKCVQSTEPSLLAWREKYEGHTQVGSAEILIEALEEYQSLFAVTLAGIESGSNQHTSQIGVLENLLHPREWNRSGSVPQIYLPEFITYVYQNLVGALHLSMNQLSLAIRMGKTRLEYGSSTMPLYQRHDITAWPALLNNSIESWKFLMRLPEAWTWLNEPFGDQEDLVAGLVAYYMSLSVLELSDMLSNGKRGELETNLNPDIPPVFLLCNRQIQRKGYRLMISDPDQVRDIWRALNVTDDDMQEAWPFWMQQTRNWHVQMRVYDHDVQLPHEELFSEI